MANIQEINVKESYLFFLLYIDILYFVLCIVMLCKKEKNKEKT